VLLEGLEVDYALLVILDESTSAFFEEFLSFLASLLKDCLLL
jgi:hypothetical protein